MLENHLIPLLASLLSIGIPTYHLNPIDLDCKVFVRSPNLNNVEPSWKDIGSFNLILTLEQRYVLRDRVLNSKLTENCKDTVLRSANSPYMERYPVNLLLFGLEIFIEQIDGQELGRLIKELQGLRNR